MPTPDSDYDEPKRPLAVGEYWAPTGIRLRDGRLYWQPLKRSHLVQPAVETFTDFVDLAEGADESVLAYARKWGVFHLCEHLLPASHQNCRPLENRTLNKGEPTDQWKKFAQEARAVWNIGEELKKGKDNVGRPADWDVLRQTEAFRRFVSNRDAAVAYRGVKRAAEEKTIISEILNRWLEIGNVRPRISWDRSHPAIDLTGGPGGRLFGALGIRLLEHAGGYEIAACTGCRKFFDASARERRPKAGQDRFCQVCFDANVPVRLAKLRKNLGISKPRKAKTK
ncbi:MAG: hypothetical protein ABR568_05705 [Pyrinomonadaceae bacterium]